MDIKEFDEEMTKNANWFAGEMRKLHTEWESRLSATLEAGKAANIPEHLLVASAINTISILENEAEEIQAKP